MSFDLGVFEVCLYVLTVSHLPAWYVLFIMYSHNRHIYGHLVSILYMGDVVHKSPIVTSLKYGVHQVLTPLAH